MTDPVPSKDQVSYLLAKLCWHTCTCQNATSPSVQHGVYCVYEQARASMPTHEPGPVQALIDAAIQWRKGPPNYYATNQALRDAVDAYSGSTKGESHG